MIQTDYLIVGSGVAGLSLALKLADRFPTEQVVVITKSAPDESNTKYAQGGIAIVTHINDSFEKHIQDTLICGDGLCDEEVVRIVVEKAPKFLEKLISWGASFDKKNENEFCLGKEGGHSDHRIIHHKDQTGYEIERAIVKKAQQQPNIQIYQYHLALDIIKEQDKCVGVEVYDIKNQKKIRFFSKYMVLATGGIGQVYGHTTNPSIATADGIAMAARAKVQVKDMEFIQFHPTALYNQNLTTTFLISEAVRGYGAYLRNVKGERFMARYDQREELAPRDVVSQSIYNEMNLTQTPYVYVDCTHLDTNEFKEKFPMIYNQCISVGIDIAKDYIPVAPCQHYICGGIVVDLDGKTSLDNLFACGECSRTGLHGANRLASNSLLEALVYSGQIFNYIVNHPIERKAVQAEMLEQDNQNNIALDTIDQIRKEVQSLMTSKAGIIRNDSDLKKVQTLLEHYKSNLNRFYLQHEAYFELKNILEVALLIIEASLLRNENRGTFVKK
ncbi:MAG: L-aspartate oxidase [Bacteroidota bacterium]|nr:L-aspartate oxidase [Bacteroidota bacterium]